MTHHETIQEIRKMISEEDMLCQLAEECAELAQAALKLRRAVTQTNPTTVTNFEAIVNLQEEAADVLLCLRVLPATAASGRIVDSVIFSKADRWLNRLREVRG
ncbi:MAG: hypothetical protein IJX47_02350 [Clostridia bacterium]|nr:hypothetical protein [Clostridia bacterium]